MNAENPYDLPQSAAIFDALRGGKHICPEDGAIYHALEGHRAEYEALFESLGLELRRHRQGFFYLRGGSDLSKTPREMGVFMLILVDWLADQGGSIEERLMGETFYLDDLPHFGKDRYRQYMKELGAGDRDDLVRIVRSLERYGFAERGRGPSFRFRTPAYRFLDLCFAALDEREETPDANGTAGRHA